MKVIFGLGNPTEKFSNTRHNVGYLYVDAIAEVFCSTEFEEKYDAYISYVKIADEECLLAKPITYMNTSGISLNKIMVNYNLLPKDVVVVYDDVSLPLGSVRIRQKGRHGGHNGVKSIIENICTEKFVRIKFGIGSPKDIDLYDYVLSDFSIEERNLLKYKIYANVYVVESLLKNGYNKTVGLYNNILNITK